MLVRETDWRMEFVRCVKTRRSMPRDWELLDRPIRFVYSLYERMPGTDVATLVESRLSSNIRVRFDPRRLPE